jgi:hypothetical protein
MVERLTSAEAASQIIGLFNSKPTTPWPAEVKAIIDRVAKVPTVTPAMPDHVVAYQDRAREFLRQCKVVGPMRHTEPNYEAEYQRSTELSNRVDEVGAVILETPIETWGDLIGLASIVAHEAGHDLDALGDRRTNDGDPGPIAAEMLALAVLQLHAGAVPQLLSVDPLGEVSLAFANALSDWRKAHDQYEHAAEVYGSITPGAEHEQEARAQVRRWEGEYRTKTRTLLDLGVTSFAELQLLLPVLVAWNFPTHVCSPNYPEWAIADCEDQAEDWGERSTAYFVRSTARLLEAIGRTAASSGQGAVS